MIVCAMCVRQRTLLFNWFWFLIALKTVMTAIDEKRLKSSDHKWNNEIYDHNKSGKCEIRVVTSGVCSVNNHLIKPKIVFKHASTLNQVPVYVKSKMDQRFRNMDNSMNSVRIGENKANQIVDEFLLKYKEQYRRQIDPLMIKDFGKFDLQDLGTVMIFDLFLRGISNVKRDGSVILHSNSQMNRWSINTNLSIDNITADFKADAQLKNKVFINGWTLQILIKRCVLSAVFELDGSTKMMTLSSLMVNAVDGFSLNSENLSQPFAQVVQHIVERQMQYLKDVIGSNAQKYFSQTLMSFNVSKIVEQMNMFNMGNAGTAGGD